MSFAQLIRPLPRLAAASLLLSLALPASPAGAQTAAPAAQPPASPARFAVIDVESILTESANGQRALQEIDQLRKQKEAQGKQIQEEIAGLRARLQEGRLSLSEDALAGLQKELQEKVIAAQRFNDDATRELSLKRDTLLAQIEKSVFPIINEVGREGGYTLIFNKFNSGLVYAHESVDITAQVIARYNAQTGGAGN